MGLFFQFEKSATFQIRKLSNSRNKKNPIDQFGKL